MRYPIILQTIDSPRRDFEWRLWMAKEFAKHNIASVIGFKPAIRELHRRSRNCIFFGRLNSTSGRSTGDRVYLTEMDKKGTKVFFLHDEGAFFLKGRYKEFVKLTYPVEYLDNDIFIKIYFWGNSQKNIFDNYKYLNEKVSVVGCPRFDLCKSKYSYLDSAKVNSIKHKYGDFYLIAGRFPVANKGTSDNHALSLRTFELLKQGYGYKYSNSSIIEQQFGNWAKVNKEFVEFVLMIKKLASDFPEKKFIVRPHPSESQLFYDEAFFHFGNIVVSKEGDVRPWIHACDLVIQSECTTGVEAIIAGKTTINFRPQFMCETEYGVSGLTNIGYQAKSYTDVYQALISFEMGQKLPYPRPQLENHLMNCVENVEAAPKIVEDIHKYALNNNIESKIENLSQYERSKNFLRKIKNKVLKKSSNKYPSDLSAESKIYELKDDYVLKLWCKMGGDKRRIKTTKEVIYTNFR